jgi:hypothetical protein
MKEEKESMSLHEMPEQFYKNMLSNPECKIHPEWMERALIDWMKRNFAEFLKQNPGFVRYVYQNVGVNCPGLGDVVPLDEAHEDIVRNVLANAMPLYSLPLGLRLMDAGKADLVAEIGHEDLMADESLWRPHINKMPTETLVKIMKRIDWDGAIISDLAIMDVAKRLSPEEIVEVLGMKDADMAGGWRPKAIAVNNAIPIRSLSIMLGKLPSREAKCLAQYCVNLLGPMCMKCGQTCQSKSGLVQHRKKCDPENEYPSPYSVLDTH